MEPYRADERDHRQWRFELLHIWHQKIWDRKVPPLHDAYYSKRPNRSIKTTSKQYYLSRTVRRARSSQVVRSTRQWGSSQWTKVFLEKFTMRSGCSKWMPLPSQQMHSIFLADQMTWTSAFGRPRLVRRSVTWASEKNELLTTGSWAKGGGRFVLL